MKQRKPQSSLPDALRLFDALPDSAYVRQPVVTSLFSISDATLWRRVRDGKLPEPMRFGRVTSWQVGKLRRVLGAAAR